MSAAAAAPQPYPKHRAAHQHLGMRTPSATEPTSWPVSMAMLLSWKDADDITAAVEAAAYELGVRL